MDILDHVIQIGGSFEWTGVDSSVASREDYRSNTYRLFDLTSSSEEYTREIEAFKEGNLNERITQIQRVQNPFQLGRFLLRKEQRRFRNISIEESKYYHPLKNQSQLTTALEYNMDVRRYGDACDGQMSYDKKNPRFYKTPRDAFNAIPINCQYILVCAIFETGSDTSTIKTNDTEYMPVYVVKLVE